MDKPTAALIAQIIQKGMKRTRKSKEALISLYVKTETQEYGTRLRDLVCEAEAVLGCAVENYKK